MEKTNYWCYRIDRSKIQFFKDELYEGRLRQGWGWDEKQDLRKLEMDSGAKRNLPMFNKVKKDDILLVPALPSSGEVAIVKATEDWSKGYKFEIQKGQKDYGHIFPAEIITSFTRRNEHVSGSIRSTLRNPSRFWNINQYAEDVEVLQNIKDDELKKSKDYVSKMDSLVRNAFNENFNEDQFIKDLEDRFNHSFTSEEWEFILVKGLQLIFPFYHVERVGGNKEKEHGTDILIKLPSIPGRQEYAIAIQVKDYKGIVGNHVIDQIKKADQYWESQELKLIDKWVIITEAEGSLNGSLKDDQTDVKIIFKEDLKKVLGEIGKKMIGVDM